MLSMKVDNDTIWNDFIKTGKKVRIFDSRLEFKKYKKKKKKR
jgi:hypothetical protein